MTPALAIVLARAGSKGLPRKNTRPVAGKPCAQWTLEAALAAKHVGKVVLSTDDAELLTLAGRLDRRITPIDRPAELANDTATIDAAARHALAASGQLAELSASIVILYANVPVRPPKLIDEALALLSATRCDSVQSYAAVGKHHPWWTARLDPATGKVGPWEGDVLNHNVFRRQDLPPAYIPDGGVIALTRSALTLQVPAAAPGPHQFFGVDRRGLVSAGPVIDIDTEIDLLVAEAHLKSKIM